MTDLTDEAVKAIAAAKPSMLFADQDEDICIDDGRANNLVFCPARDDAVFPGDWPVLNPDVVAEIVARYNAAPDLARALLDARADAEAAVALALEEAAVMVEGIPDNTLVTPNQRLVFEPVAARIRALAPADGLAAVEALRVEARENAMQALASMGQAQEAYEAQLEAEAELAAAQQREAALTKALEACVASLERVDTAEGVCCCGDSMDRHSDPMSCGHSPVDMGDYYAGQALESARAALAPTPTDPGDGWTWNERLGWIGPDGKPADPRRRG